MDQVRDLALEHRPEDDRRRHDRATRVASTPSRSGRSPTRSARCFLFDAAHIAGLIAGGAAPEPGAVRRRRHVHDAQDAARPAWRLHPVARRSTPRRSTRPCSPGWQGGPLEHVIAGKAVAFREAAHPSFKEYAHQIVANAVGAGRGAGGRGLPAGVGRHRQPPDGRRPAPVRRRAHRQGRPDDARRGRHHAEQEHDPRRPAQPVRHERPAHRHPVGDDAGDGGAGDGRRSPRSSPQALRDRDDADAWPPSRPTSPRSAPASRPTRAEAAAVSERRCARRSASEIGWTDDDAVGRGDS